MDLGAAAPDSVRAVLHLDEALRTAMWNRDFDAIERLYTSEFTLNSPAQRLQTREETIDLLRTTNMQQTDVERTIEAAYAVGDAVIIMGEESLTWQGTGSELDGRRSARRFTNVWYCIDGEWCSIARHTNTVPISG